MKRECRVIRVSDRELRKSEGREEELISRILVREKFRDRAWALLPVAMLVMLALIGYYGPYK